MDRVARQPVGRGQPGEGAVLDAKESAAARAEPKGALSVFEDRPDLLGSDLGERRIGDELAVAHAVDATVGADDDVAAPQFRKRSYAAIGETVIDVQRDEPVTGPSAESAAGGDPEVAVPVLQELADAEIAQAVRVAELLGTAAIGPQDPAAVAAEPVDAVPVLQHGADLKAGGQRVARGAAIRHAVQAGGVGRDPDFAARILIYRRDAVDR